ncbi:astacin [Eurytemora carolleeae]|uniref:astacin n=1 Tax=Eurytemora carolleeae TaxID=1294199 RepID=UPI000C78BCC6|nr:astacin [Eurytemora carolleeae]|eukprot:XP_023348591.1 astacin-like [Eurytemora affinis]
MDRSVNSHTKSAYIQVMRELERGSCVIFKETTSTNQKYLTLTVGRDCYDRYDTGVAGGVTTGAALNQNQTLNLSHKLCSSNSRDNVKYLKVVRHEFLHVFGLMHTQTRKDRDNYVWVDTSNIKDTKEAQYEICMDCKTFDAPYECNSIMHYEANTFAKNHNKDVMYSKVCKINPGDTLTDWDWKLLNKAAKCPGS